MQSAAQIVVHCAKSQALSTLLRGAGGHFERQVNELSNAADPERAGTAVHLAGDVGGVAGDLAALLLRARAEGNPAAEGVADLLRQLGAEVPEPEPVPEPRPTPAAKPAPPRPPVPSAAP